MEGNCSKKFASCSSVNNLLDANWMLALKSVRPIGSWSAFVPLRICRCMLESVGMGIPSVHPSPRRAAAPAAAARGCGRQGMEQQGYAGMCLMTQSHCFHLFPILNNGHFSSSQSCRALTYVSWEYNTAQCCFIPCFAPRPPSPRLTLLQWDLYVSTGFRLG